MQSILVIDDDKLMRLALAKILISAGYNVVQASDGDEGLGFHRAQHFDLIITDLIMPDKEGIQIIRELRRDNNKIRIIAMSAGGRGGSHGLPEVGSPHGRQEVSEQGHQA